MLDHLLDNSSTGDVPRFFVTPTRRDVELDDSPAKYLKRIILSDSTSAGSNLTEPLNRGPSDLKTKRRLHELTCSTTIPQVTMLLREVTNHSDAGHDDNTRNKMSKLPYTVLYLPSF